MLLIKYIVSFAMRGAKTQQTLVNFRAHHRQGVVGASVKNDLHDENSTKVRKKRRFLRFFRFFIDLFSIYRRPKGFKLPKTHFFKNFIMNASDRKDLNSRQRFKFFRFFVLDTNCLQIVDYKTSPSLLREDLNPRNAKKIFQNQFIKYL